MKKALLNSSSLSPLFLLGAASAALFGAGPAKALEANALPQGGNVVGGSAAISQAGNTLNVNQSSNRTVIDWRSFNIGSAATTNFNQPNSSSIAVNRVNASANPSQIQGTLNANGQVWILNPNGVFFGKTAQVNAAGIVASTANIDVGAFMGGSNRLNFNGGDKGSVVNEGNITVGQGGLAAFVAPSVRNSGTITATVGKVALAAGDTFTLDLAGDHLVEIGLGATKAVVDQSGKIVNAGGTIQISAKAATQLVDSVINMSGVTDASSISSNGGQIIIGADDINVASSAQTNANAGQNGNGGAITMVANKTGNFDGSYSAQGGAQSGDGGNIETSGGDLHIADSIKVNTSAANGKTGNWTLDPTTLTVGATGTATISNGTNSPDASTTIAASTIDTALNGNTNVTLLAKNAININVAIDTHTQTNSNTLFLNDEDANGALTINLKAPITLGVNQTLAGDGTTINVGTTGAGASQTFGLIQNGIDAASATNAAKINVIAGTFNEALVINNKTITLDGAGATTILNTPASATAEILVEGGANATIENLTVKGLNQGDGKGTFTGIQIENSNATINKVDITGFQDSTLGGGQHGIGIAAYNYNGPSSVTITNSTIDNFQKGGIALDGNAITVDIEGNTVTGAGPTGLLAQNGIQLFGRTPTSYLLGAGSVSGTVANNIVTGIDYLNAPGTPPNKDIEAVGILLWNSPNAIVKNNTVTGGAENVGSAGLYALYSAGLSVSGNKFTNADVGVALYQSGGTITGGTISGNTIGVQDSYSIGVTLTGVNFATNGTQFTGTTSEAAQVFAHNQFDAAAHDTASGTINSTIGDALGNSTSGDTIDIRGNFALSNQLEINKTVSLVGSNSATIGAAADFVGDGQSGAMILVDSGVNFGLSNATVTGLGHSVYQGVRSEGNTTIMNVDFNNIEASASGAPYDGDAVEEFAGKIAGGIGSDTNASATLAGTLTITNSTFEKIGREGILVKGDGATATVTGITYTGKGDGDWLDYGVEAGAGAGVTISHSSITGNTGVANDGSTSAGIIVTTYFGSGTNATITNNVLSGNTIGVDVGFDANDTSVVHASNNDLSQSTNGVYATSTKGTLDFSGNWWGMTNGASIEASLGGAAAGSVDISPFLNTNKNTAGSGFSGDFSDITVTAAGTQTGTTGLIAEGIQKVTAHGTLDVENGIYTENVNDATKAADIDFGSAVVIGGTLTVGATGTNLSGTVAANSVNLKTAVGLDGGLSLDTSAAGGNITAVEVDGTGTGGQNLTLKTGSGTASLGNVGTAVLGLGAVSDNNATTLTGTIYNALSFLFGKLTLNNATTITASGANGITTGTVDAAAAGPGVTVNPTLALNATAGTVSLGDIGDATATAAMGAVTSTGATTLTGTNYEAASFNLGAVTLAAPTTPSVTTITADDAAAADIGITIASVGGTVADQQSLTLGTKGSSVSLGNVSDPFVANPGAELGTVTASGNVTLTGSQYYAKNFDLGAVTLTDVGNTINIHASGANTAVTIGSVDDDVANNEALSLQVSGGSIKLGNVGANHALGVLSDNADTTFTGTTYNANSFQVDAVTLGAADGSTTAITAANGIAMTSLDGTDADKQNVTLTNTSSGTISLGNVSDPFVANPGAELGTVTASGNVTLTGSQYYAKNFDLGAVTLTDVGNTINIHASGANTAVTIGSVDDDVANNEALSLQVSGGSIKLGNVGANHALGVLSDNADTTFTGTTYNANSFQVDAVTLGAADGSTTAITAANGIAMTSLDGTDADKQNVTLTNTSSGIVSLGNVGAGTALGDVNDLNATTLTGTTYHANSLEFAAVTLGAPATTDPITLITTPSLTTITADDATAADTGITIASVDGTAVGAQSLTLSTSGSSVSLGNVGQSTALAAVSDNNPTTLTGAIYKAISFLFGNVTLTSSTDATSITASNGGITIGSVDGNSATVSQDLTLSATGTVSLGDVGDTTADKVGAVSTGAVTLSGDSYVADSFDLGAVTLASSTNATGITANNGGITISSVDGNSGTTSQGLTLGATGTVSLGDVGDTTADKVGAVSTGAVTLSGDSYVADSFDLGAVTLASSTNATGITANNGGITISSVDGNSGTTSQGLTLGATGTVSLGDVGDTTADKVGAVSTGAVTLSGDSYVADSFDLGAVTLASSTNATGITANNGGLTLASVDGNSATTAQDLTLGATGTVSLGDVGDNTATALMGAVTDTSATTLTGSNYEAGSFKFGALTLDNTTTITANSTAGGTIITIGSVKGVAADTQGLTLNAKGGTVSLGDVDTAPSDALGAVIDTNNQGTELTGGTYDAASFAFGATTLGASPTTITADTGGISMTSVDGTGAGGQNLTLNASHGTVSLGDIGDNVAIGTLTDNNATELTGAAYSAASLGFGNLTLDQNTSLTATNGGITIGTVDSSGVTTGPTLGLTASHGTVSLGDIGDATPTMGDVNDNGAATTLTGSSYKAASLEFGATTLTSGTHATSITATNGITLGSVDGNSTSTAQGLTLSASNVSLGNVDATSSNKVGAVSDNNPTTLTGTIYKALSFLFGNLTLDNTTTITANSTSGGTIITIGSVKGVAPDAQGLTLNAAGGKVMLGDVDALPSDALGAVIDTNNHGTELTGGTYDAASFAFGATTLDTNTAITADTGNIALASVDGSGAGSQTLGLTASHGTVSLGDVGDSHTATVGDVNDNGAATTLTGSSYKAASFELGATALDNDTTFTASGTGTAINIASVDASGGRTFFGHFFPNHQNLTLNATNGTVLLGDIGDKQSLGTVTDTNNKGTTLTGDSYEANSFAFGGLLLTQNTGITADSGNISTGTVDGSGSGGQTLTLNASQGGVSLGDIGDNNSIAMGAVTDNNTNDGTELTGTSYKAASFVFDDLTLDHTTAITSATGGITTGTVDGASANNQSLTLTSANGLVSLGSVGTHARLNLLTDNNNNNTTTLTGSTYNANSLAFDNLVLDTGTTITANSGTITAGNVEGSGTNGGQSLTLSASGHTVSLGNAGDLKALGTVTDTNNTGTTLTGATYKGSSLSFGNLILTQNPTGITATNGGITAGKVDGSGAGGEALALHATGTVSLGDIGDATATMGDVNDNSAATTLTGSSYKAASFELGATTLASGTHATSITGANGITLASVDGNSTSTAQGLTLSASNVSLGNVDGTSSNKVGAVSDNNPTTLTGTIYKALSFLFGNLTLGHSGTTAITASGGNITTGSVEGSGSGGQGLTLSASGHTVSLGNVGDTTILGTVTDTANNGTTLTGSTYAASSFNFGDLTLSHSGTTTITASGGNITAGNVDGSGNPSGQSLALNASTVSLGDVGDSHAATVGDVNDHGAATTLTGSSYKAASFELGATTLDNDTSITASGTGAAITIASVQGDGSRFSTQDLTLNAASGTVSLGNANANSLGAVTDTNNKGTTLTGTGYSASSFAFGNLILAQNTTITASNGDISTGTVDASNAGGQTLTLNASRGGVTLGDIGDNNSIAMGAVSDNNTNDGTELTGTSYKAASFNFDDLTLDHSTTITSNTGGITAGTVNGASSGGQSLTLTSANGLVSLGSVGTSRRLNQLVDNNTNNTTTLTGSTYNANSVAFDNLVLDNGTTITTTNGNITAGNVEGSGSAGGQSLTLSAVGHTVSLGNLGDTKLLGAVTDTNNNGTTLTGTTYDASSFAFGNLVLTQNTAITASGHFGNITIAKVDGTTADAQTLGLSATNGGRVSVGDIGDTTAVGMVTDTTATTLTGSSYKAAGFDFGALTLNNATAITADTGNIIAGTVDGSGTTGGQNLTLSATSGTISLGDIGDTKVLGTVTDTANNGTTLTGGSYKAASFAMGAVTLDSTLTTIDTSAKNGAVSLASVDGSTTNGQSLTLKTGTGVATLGNMGATTALGTVTDSGAVTLTGNTYNGASFELGAVTLASGVNATVNASGDVTLASLDGTNVDGESLEILANTTSLGNVGGTTALNEVRDAGNMTLTGASYNATEFDLGNVTLDNGTTFTGSAANLVSVNGSGAGGQNLTFNDTTFVTLGNMGANIALGNVIATADIGTTLNGSTSKAASFDFGTVLVAGISQVSLDTSAANGSITIGSLDGVPFTTNAGLSLNAGNGTVSLGSVGAGAGGLIPGGTVVGAVQVTAGSTTLTGNAYTEASLNITGPTTLTAATTTLNTSADNGAITVGAVNGTTAGANALTVNAGTGTVSLGNLGATTRLGAVSDTSSTTLTGGTYNANSLNFGGAVKLTQATTTLNTSADNGAITVGSANGTTAGANALTVNAGTGTVSLGNLGATTRLGAVTDPNITTLTGTTYDANSFLFGGAVTLTSATTTLNTTQSASAAGDITFNADILGTSNGGQSLTLTAGPGTGLASANGNITLQNAGTAALQLGNLTDSGNNFSALTVHLAGNYGATLVGNQTIAANTLDVGGNVIDNVGGNADGHIVANGNLTMTVGGDIDGVLAGNNVTLIANTITNSDITGLSSIFANANSITGTSFHGPLVTIVANNVNITVDATTLQIDAAGVVNGTWTNLNTGNSTNLLINGEQVEFVNAQNPQQLTVENFNLPPGTQIAANGTLILPAGLVIGLLSPGGGEPRVVLVHSVQELGELLSDGFVAIVIDLSGRKKDDNMQLADNTTTN